MCNGFRLCEFYKRVHAAAEHLNSYQRMRTRYYNHNVNHLMSKLSARDRLLFGFDMSVLSWDDYFDKYLRGLRVYLMGNRLHGTNNSNTLNRCRVTFRSPSAGTFASTAVRFRSITRARNGHGPSQSAGRKGPPNGRSTIFRSFAGRSSNGCTERFSLFFFVFVTKKKKYVNWSSGKNSFSIVIPFYNYK